jgi:hypothetical protein
MKHLIALAIALLLTGAARAQSQSTMEKLCTSGIKEACDIRAEAAGTKHVIHMQEFLSDLCRMGTTEYPLTDDDEQTACTVRDELAQTLKDWGYRWDNDEKEWVSRWI